MRRWSALAASAPGRDDAERPPISGESANFLGGGEFPIPGNYNCDPQTAAADLGASGRSSASVSTSSGGLWAMAAFRLKVRRSLRACRMQRADPDALAR